MNEQELNDVVCNQCSMKISDSQQFVKVRPPSTIAYGCGHCVIDYFNGEIINYLLYWDKDTFTYRLEAPPNENQTHFWMSSVNGWNLINTFDYVLPLPIRDGLLEIDKLIQRLLNMKVFY